MKDEDKTKDQLTNELVEMRQRISELEKSETDLKKAERAVQETREYAESIVETVREPLLVLDADLKIISANHSFYQTFKVIPEETKGQLLYDLGNGQWDIPKLRQLLEKILPKNNIFEDFKVEHDFPTIGR
jgi:PAS domain-containing protein